MGEEPIGSASGLMRVRVRVGVGVRVRVRVRMGLGAECRWGWWGRGRKWRRCLYINKDQYLHKNQPNIYSWAQNPNMQDKLSSRGFFLGAGAVGSKTWLRRRDSALDAYRNGKVTNNIITAMVLGDIRLVESRSFEWEPIKWRLFCAFLKSICKYIIFTSVMLAVTYRFWLAMKKHIPFPVRQNPKIYQNKQFEKKQIVCIPAAYITNIYVTNIYI